MHLFTDYRRSPLARSDDCVFAIRRTPAFGPAADARPFPVDCLRAVGRDHIMSKAASRCTRRMWATMACAVLVSSAVIADMPAKRSRVMTVYVRDSADEVLEAFRLASSAATLHCQSLRVGDGAAIQCRPSDAGKGFQGFAEAREIKKHHAVFVSAYSSNVSTPHGELLPAVRSALENFRRAIENDPNVLRLDECAAPDYHACVLPP